jgi:sugar phosphate isomerase/epimerase
MYSSLNARAVGLNLTADATLELAARAGFAAVDLMVRDLLDAGDDPRRLRSRMDVFGLRGGSFPMPVHWRGDTARFSHDLSCLPRLANAAAELGLMRTTTWVMPETSEQPATPSGRAAHHAEVVRLHVERLGAIARELDRFGIRLGLEVIGVASSRTGRGLPFVHRLADLDRVLGRVRGEAPNFGILLDGWHLYAAGESVEAGLVWGLQGVVGVHVADLPASALRDRAAMIDDDRGLPGENGGIDSKTLLQRLGAAGYDGPVAAEPMPRGRILAGLEPEAIAHRVAAALRLVWPDDSSRN